MGTMQPPPVQDDSFERLVVQLGVGLSVNEFVTEPVWRVRDVAEWRKAARTAGRRMRVPVRTALIHDGATLVAEILTPPHDWTPLPEGQRDIKKEAYERQAHEAADRVADYIYRARKKKPTDKNESQL